MSNESERERLRTHLRDDFPDIRAVLDQDLDEEVRGADAFADPVELVRSRLRPPLFDYQRDLVGQIVNYEGPSCLLGLPTGAGKTRTAVAATLESIADKGYSRVAWLAPSIELVDQAQETFETLWLTHGAVEQLLLTRNLSAHPATPAVTFTTPQAVYAAQQGVLTGHWDLVIFDEAHQLGARTFRQALKSLGVGGAGRSPVLLGLSATPGRVDEAETEDLVRLFGGALLRSDRLAPNPVEVLQRRGVLARLKFRRLTRRTVPPEAEGHRLKIAARACRELAGLGRRTLVFAGSVAGAEVLAEALQSVGTPAEAVHADLSRGRRARAIKRFSEGKTHVLTNQRLLATGYDCPAVTDVLVLSRIGSPILFEQIVGRAARGPRTGGSPTANIWDFDDHLTIHGLPTSYYRYRDFDWGAGPN